MHGNIVAGVVCKARLENKLLRMWYETYSAVIQGMDLPAQAASSQC